MKRVGDRRATSPARIGRRVKGDVVHTTNDKTLPSRVQARLVQRLADAAIVVVLQPALDHELEFSIDLARPPLRSIRNDGQHVATRRVAGVDEKVRGVIV